MCDECVSLMSGSIVCVETVCGCYFVGLWCVLHVCVSVCVMTVSLMYLCWRVRVGVCAGVCFMCVLMFA